LTCLGSRKSLSRPRDADVASTANELYCDSRKRLFAEKLQHNLEFIADAATGKPAFLLSSHDRKDRLLAAS
jgi:hypothetical protein